VRVQLHALRRLAEAEGCDPEMVREHLAQIDREIEAIVWLVREALGEAEPSEL
jgi:hypothetical protein